MHGELIEYSNNVYNYIPDLNYNGDDSFNFNVYDGFWYSNTATVSIFITGVNDPPVLSSVEDVLFNEDESTSININAYDVDEDLLSFDISIGQNIFASIEESSITFTSNLDFNGTENFVVIASDGELTDSQSFDVTVMPINDAPYFTILLEQVYVNEDIEYLYDFSVCSPSHSLNLNSFFNKSRLTV